MNFISTSAEGQRTFMPIPQGAKAMTETLDHWRVDNLDELKSAIADIETTISAERQHPATVYTPPLLVSLVRETLTDQSTVLNITIKVRT